MKAMLRRLLACLAILTGLATAASPAQARMNAAIAQSFAGGESATVPSTGLACATVQPVRNARDKAPVAAPCRPRKPIIIYIPTVQFGADRARE